MSRSTLKRPAPDFSLEVTEEEGAEWREQNPPEHSWWAWIAERWTKPELPARPFPAALNPKD